MDEHLSIQSGRTIEMTHQFVDDNQIPIGQFIEKHNGYATREAALLLDAEYQLTDVGQLPTIMAKKSKRNVLRKPNMPGCLSFGGHLDILSIAIS